ncbi:MAG: hypothetical protein HYS27_13810 [Deltaproteobacteria bacterium]|nr:hypothetical protein [Deltaproteobacteria bacterium]
MSRVDAVLLLGVVALQPACPLEAPRCEQRWAASIPLGTVPNDVALGECGGAPVALVPASGDARLDVLELPCGELRASVLFAPEGERAATPWAVAVDGERAWVTLQGHDEVALVDYCAGEVLARVRAAEVLELVEPLRLSAPQDVDGDGTPEIEVRRMLPRAPQAVVAAGGVAVLAYTNLLEPGLAVDRPPVLGPGLLARFDGEATSFAPHTVVLPCTNPQGLAWHDEALWVSCTGPLGPTNDATVAALGVGALVRVDPVTLATLEEVAAGSFAPGTPAILDTVLSGEVLVVGSLLRPALARVADGWLVETAIGGAAVDSIFECARMDAAVGARAVCTHFSGDRLLVVDDPIDSLHVAAELPVGAGSAVFRGAQAVALGTPAARARGVGAAVVLGLSAELALLPVEVLP